MGKQSYKDEEEYRRRRERNNEAVKKSRVKSKMRSQATQDRVQQLQNDNTKLEEKIKYLASEVDFLKEMLCANQGGDGNQC
ncbi:CCAAT/enhancer-binding protein gamma isoform X2 [Neocloeon triangulifer]|uniref:CCAAT/enhancer-binding protein gamma isoform X2 n=1 Tax=Neocloeon triangulifer TaxID=2078957 RepID=UPI00286FA802|nr:CCAAT/enhancer-binding protein gamma isoform X2 [Neocloeon triangulifer]